MLFLVECLSSHDISFSDNLSSQTVFFSMLIFVLLFYASFCFRGLKAYLSKWKSKGFDVDVRRLASLLEAGSIAQAEQMVLTDFTPLHCCGI